MKCLCPCLLLPQPPPTGSLSQLSPPGVSTVEIKQCSQGRGSQTKKANEKSRKKGLRLWKTKEDKWGRWWNRDGTQSKVVGTQTWHMSGKCPWVGGCSGGVFTPKRSSCTCPRALQRSRAGKIWCHVCRLGALCVCGAEGKQSSPGEQMGWCPGALFCVFVVLCVCVSGLLFVLLERLCCSLAQLQTSP